MDLYAGVGVDYELLDAAKRSAGRVAGVTAGLLVGHGAQEIEGSRGQSAYVLRLGGQTIAFVLECLGTKSLIARDYLRETGENRWADVARDTVAAVVNDLAAVGSLPVVVNAYFATGSADWFARWDPAGELVRGWAEACADSGAAWGGGETPTLRDLVGATAIDLAGSGIGRIPEQRRAVLGQDLQPGDEIVLVESSGLHANGASVARSVAASLPGGLAWLMPSGLGYGDALLRPGLNYSRLVGALLASEAPVSYFVHITGHGWRKIMRADREFRYLIHTVPDVPEVLTETVRAAGMSVEEAYATFNMGAGFAVMVRPGHGQQVVATAEAHGYSALIAGEVRVGARSVEVSPLGLSYGGSSMELL